jgi:hemerythrin-like domain-containing protein
MLLALRLKMEKCFFSEKFINFYQTTRRHIKGDRNVNFPRLENLTSHELDAVTLSADVRGTIV